MDDTTRNRQRVLAMALPLSTALLVIGEVLTPKGLDQIADKQSVALKMVAIAATHRTQLYFSNVLALFGLATFGVSFSAIATLIRQRGATVATSAAVLGAIGAFCGAIANVLVGFNLASAVGPHSTPQSAATFLVTTFTSSVGQLFLLGYLLGLAVALILVVIAVWRSRCMPRWIPFVLLVAWEVAAFAHAGIVAIPFMVPLVATMILVTTYVWRGPTAATTPTFD